MNDWRRSFTPLTLRVPSPCGGEQSRHFVHPQGEPQKNRPHTPGRFLSWGIQVDFGSETHQNRHGIRAVSAQPTERIRK